MIKNLVYYLICFSIQNIAQIEEINPVVVGQPEVYIQTSSSNAKTVEAELISTSYWFGLRNIFFTAEVNFNSTGGVVTVIDFSDQQKGWDWISEDNDNPSRGYIGWGLYKFHHFSSGSYFYIDYRDSDWERNYPPHTPDHYIFIEDEDIFYFAYTDNITPRSVENGERVNIWEEWGYSEPDYSDFPSDFWENSLGLDRTNDYLVL
ncbi:MAG: hypothetical protein K8F36_13395, partial [Melioribacteraceae bacterium]|nr:hypothetical protein [Melioribacteraceae bacterium]